MGLAVENARLYSQTQSALSEVTEINRLKDEIVATLSRRSREEPILGHEAKRRRLEETREEAEGHRGEHAREDDARPNRS